MTPFAKTKLYTIFKEKGAICQMVPFVTKHSIALTILVKAKGAICLLCEIVTLCLYEYVIYIYGYVKI